MARCLANLHQYSLVAGSPYSANQNVPIVFSATATDADNDLASILWALDNDDNYNDANGVSKSFSQAGTYTVLVKATDATGLTDTALVTVIISDVTPPITTAAPLGGTYNTAQSVTLTANEAAAIYYTTNGSIPTTSSTQYSAAIPISATTTLKYFAKDTRFWQL